jgi:hypothetical protein
VELLLGSGWGISRCRTGRHTYCPFGVAACLSSPGFSCSPSQGMGWLAQHAPATPRFL